MNRSSLQQIAFIRVKEAGILLENGCYEGAYYLTGYAVECAFKAYISKRTKRYDFPDRKRVMDSHTHDLEKLLFISGLKSQHQFQLDKSPEFVVNWNTVLDWRENTRYTAFISETDAINLFAAVTAPENGILTWLKKFW